MAEIKTKQTKKSPVAFINALKEPQRADAKKLLAIFKEVTGMKPVLWSNGMVSFGLYHYKSERSSQEGDWPLAAFAPRASNLTVYVMSGAKNYVPLLKKLGKHKISGGSCIYINKLSDIHIPTLKTLVRQSVRDMRKKYKMPGEI
jgi:hypothetical protein